MNSLHLTPSDQQRIERIAKAAGCTSEHAFTFVLRDGFDETERVLRAVTRARASVATQGVIDHATAMARLDDLLNQHAASNQAA